MSDTLVANPEFKPEVSPELSPAAPSVEATTSTTIPPIKALAAFLQDKWWEKLQEDRASRAILRRTTSLDEVCLTPVYQRLYQFLKKQHLLLGEPPAQQDRLALTLGVLARVKENASDSLPALMGLPAEGSDRPRVSTLRFQRLLESPDLDDLYNGLCRTLALTRYHANVQELAVDLLTWGNATRKRWAYTYPWPAL